ncbi:MAG: low molecular weight phosphotyrosine protein phosphatase [Alphaproteobacteria bacterium]|nr:low molecular weight phosphotyrosine protein phosphatase [Alphaproteobacteria bacterium]
MGRTSVLFVCLGNICRSPTAEGVFRAMAAEAGLAGRFLVDSAGTGSWHIGKPPDPRAVAAAARRGIDISGLRARQVTRNDLRRFEHVLAMDHRNLAVLQRLAGAGDTRPRLFLDYAPGEAGRDVPDPYLEGGFDAVLDLIEAGSRGLLAALQ